MQLVQLKAFDNIVDATLFKNVIENEGIKCFIEDEFTVTIDPLLNNAIGGIKVKVRQEDFAEAFPIMQEYYHKPLYDKDGDIIHCPKCKGIDLKEGYTQFDEHKNFFSILLSMIFLILPFLKKDKLFCRSCKQIF